MARYNNGVWTDDYGNPIPAPASLKYQDPRGTTADPFMSATDISMQNKQGTRDALAAGGVAALGTAAQLGTSLIDTAQDKYNKDRITDLTKHKGLTQGERADIDERAMRGVRTLAAENQTRTEDALAASGGHSAADLARVQRVNQQVTNDAAIQAADIGINAELQQKRADKSELESQLSYKSDRARQRLDFVAQTIAGLGKELAPVLASSPSLSAPSDAQFVAMASAKNADGSPVYPGYAGKSPADARRLWLAEYKSANAGDGAARL